jgi:hypothetical protein
MGVYRTDYLMIGKDMGGNDFDCDDFLPEIEGAPNRRFDIVYDGMSGQYCIAGRIIAKSDGYEGFELNTIDPTSLEVDRTGLAWKLQDAFGKKVIADEMKLILFSHFH